MHDTQALSKKEQKITLPEHMKTCTTECPQCGEIIGALQGSFDAICKNCGFKIPCCGD